MIPLLGFLSLPFIFGVSPVVVAPVDNTGLVTFGFATALIFSSLPSGFSVGPRYVPKWKKQACEIPAAQHPGSHYVCDEAGEVKCLPGWIGDLCDVPLCRKGCDPLQGYCRRPGECRCKLGFYGELCDKCVALPGCQHGRCNVSFECACDPGWKGLFCSEPICDPDCHPSQGYCEKPGECKCRLGWQGPKCKQCAVLPGCDHGTCQGPLECRCEPGWTGFLCQTPICSPGCSRENGGCRKPGTCRCRVGWTGSNCTECVPYPGCVHGMCRKPWECRCQPGWTGDLCDEKLTFCDDHPDTCRNNGTCVSMTKAEGNYRCICPLGYVGRKCQIETVEPATDLTPPVADQFSMMTMTQNPETLQPQEEVNSKFNKTFVNSHQGHLDSDKEVIKDDGVNGVTIEIEPLETIIITDSPSTVDPAATAGKWPIEDSSESSVIDSDNET